MQTTTTAAPAAVTTSHEKVGADDTAGAVYCNLWRVRAVLSRAWPACLFTKKAVMPVSGIACCGAFKE